MRRAFTLIELIIVIGIVSIFLSIVLINFLAPVARSSFAATLNVMISDLRRQQLKSIQGDSASPTGPAYYGVYFATDSYTLFTGQNYVASDPANVVVSLDPALRFSFINLPGSKVVFSPGSGESVGGDLSLIDVQSNLNQVIVINQYGVVDQIY